MELTFEDDQPVGRGVFGEIWRAKDVLNRDLAVKFMTNLDAHEDEYARNHAAALARVRHARVVHLIALEPQRHPRSQTLQPAIIMEFLPGTSLNKTGSLSVNDARQAAHDLVDGLIAIHSANLIHGDFHEGNVMLHNGHATLIDILYTRSLAEIRSTLACADRDQDYRELVQVLRVICDKASIPIVDVEAFVAEALREPRALPPLHRLIDVHFDRHEKTGPQESPPIEPAIPRAVSGSSISAGAPSDAHAAYEQAVSLIETGNEVRWRQQTKLRRSQLHRSLHQWRTEHDSSPQSIEDLYRSMDELLEPDVAPLLAWSIAAAEHGNSADAIGFLRDILSVNEWGGGSTLRTDMPEALVYVAHNLCGAAAVGGAHAGTAVDLATSVVGGRRDAATTHLFKRPELVAWPNSLGGQDSLFAPWKYLQALDRFPWISAAFGDGPQLRLALAGYWWTLTLIECASLVAANRFDAKVSEGTGFEPLIPPVFTMEPVEVVERAFSLAFPGPNQVNMICARFGANAEMVREGWAKWLSALKGIFAKGEIQWRLNLRLLRTPELPR